MTSWGYAFREKTITGGKRARLRAAWWIVVRRWEMEICQNCGGPVGKWLGSWWDAEDDLWLEIMPSDFYHSAAGRRVGPGVLCPACFTQRCDAKNILIYWKPVVETRV